MCCYIYVNCENCRDQNILLSISQSKINNQTTPSKQTLPFTQKQMWTLELFKLPSDSISTTFPHLSPFFGINEKRALLRQTLHTHFSMDDLLVWRKLSGLTSLVRASPLPNSRPISRQQSTWASPRNSYTGTLEGCQPRRLSSVGWTWWF